MARSKKGPPDCCTFHVHFGRNLRKCRALPSGQAGSKVRSVHAGGRGAPWTVREVPFNRDNVMLVRGTSLIYEDRSWFLWHYTEVTDDQ